MIVDREVCITGDDPSLHRLSDELARHMEADVCEAAAAAMSMSTRAVPRLVAQHIGLSPLRIIRRFRLHEAALRLRVSHELTGAEVPAELGYTDHSHSAADFWCVLDLVARDYRRQLHP